MRWLIFFVLYFLQSEGEVHNGVGYHRAIGIPKALKLMVLEGYVSRIVGGSKVTAPTAYPYQAGIVVTLTTGGSSICGGALVSNTRVITAAHCWWDGKIQARQFTIVLGSLTIFSGGTRITTRDITVHPNWNTNQITNDIAVVKITRVQFQNTIQAVQLPSTSDVNQNFAGLSAVATGYGKNSDGQNNFPATTTLHHINLNIIANTECQKKFDITLHTSHLCTSGVGGVGTCDGDSGGPLVVTRQNTRTLVGIVSFGLADGCQSGYPSVYTRVTAFLTWIQANL